VDVFQNLVEGPNFGKHNILILDQSAIYPTSGGQQHDTGSLFLLDTEYKIINAEKVGRVVLHILDKDLPPLD
jgi:alanyl-tRNA synthetase